MTASIAIVGGAVALSIVAIGAATVGQLGVTRLDVQRAADTAALAALEIARERGLPLDTAAERAATEVGRVNSALPVGLGWRVQSREHWVTVEVSARADAPVPSLFGGGGAAPVTTVARAGLPQQTFARANRRGPAVALALDYSKSMNDPFTGGQRRAIDVLEETVGGLLDLDLRLRYGAVIYNTTVLQVVPVGDGAPAAIRRAMATQDADGKTATGSALLRALGALQAAPDTGRFVLLISDGEPCCTRDAFLRARNAATALWDAGITIFTLEIRREGSGPDLARLMTDLAGTPSLRRDRRHHYVATTAAELARRLEQIASEIACTVGPIDPAPASPDALRVFLDDGTREQRLTDGPGVDDGELAYTYDAGARTIRLGPAACDAIEAGASVVVRHRRPVLLP